MSRDYKPVTARTKRTSKGSPFFSGLLVGLILGVGLSVAVTLYIQKGESPFMDKNKVQQEPPGDIKQQKSKEKPEAKEKTEKSGDINALPQNEGEDKAVKEKPRFDFYTILPGSESQVTEQEIKQKESVPEQSVVSESYYLQVGAFQTEDEADNMKAKLALQGIEAVVQTAEIPEKGVWHRVRVGPFADLEQINKTRGELVMSGFKTDLIKVRNKVPNQ